MIFLTRDLYIISAKKYMLTVFGSTALDTIRTPKKTLKNVLGGAATFAAISASFFTKPGLIAVVGSDLSLIHI